MTNVNSSILIICPIRDIFNYIIYPQNSLKYKSFLREISNIEPAEPGLGQTFNWRYLLGGIETKGSAKVTEFVSNKKFVISTTGDISSIWTYLLEEEPGGVKVTMTIVYEVKQNPIKKIINTLILNHYNQEATDDALENLKAQLEA